MVDEKDDYGNLFVEVMVILSHQLLRGEMMWIFESLLKRSLCCEVQYNQKQHISRYRFEMVRTRIFQTSGGQADWWISYWNLLIRRLYTSLKISHRNISFTNHHGPLQVILFCVSGIARLWVCRWRSNMLFQRRSLGGKNGAFSQWKCWTLWEKS